MADHKKFLEDLLAHLTEDNFPSDGGLIELIKKGLKDCEPDPQPTTPASSEHPETLNHPESRQEPRTDAPREPDQINGKFEKIQNAVKRADAAGSR